MSKIEFNSLAKKFIQNEISDLFLAWKLHISQEALLWAKTLS